MNGKTGNKNDDHHLALDRFLPYQLLVVTTSITQVAAKRFEEELGISIAESRLITAVDHFGPLSTYEVADRTRMDKAKVSRAVKQMTAAGYVTRKINDEDKRLITLTLTRTGEALRKRIVTVMEEVEHHAFERIDTKDKATLARILTLLMKQQDGG